jgi:predicted metal-dependent hydrolase
MADPSAAAADQTPAERARGRTDPLDPQEADRLFREGVALFNGARYWHAHEKWETLWRAAPDEERDFYQGLIKLAAGFLHLSRRNRRGARNKLAEGIAHLERYGPIHEGIGVGELVGKAKEVLADLNAGANPYLIAPSIRFVATTVVDR